jgi:hypothetical protein
MSAISTYSELLRTFSSITEKDEHLIGKILSTSHSLALLKQASDYELCSDSVSIIDENGLELSKKTIASLNNKTFGLEIEVKLLSDIAKDSYYIGRNWGTLLSHNKYLIACPHDVLLINEDKNTQNNKKNNLAQICKLCSLIKSISHRKIGNEVIIYLRELLSVNIQISTDTLDNTISLSNIEIFTDHSIHKETKELLLKESLIRFLRDTPEETRLDFLVKNFGNFSSGLILSYEKFITNYSFDKLRREYLEKKSEYIEKINNAFDGVSLKLLSLPATVWISLTQLGAVSSDDGNFIKNLGVLIATFFVTFFILASLLGQFPLLRALKAEYRGLFNRLDESTNTENIEIKESLKDLDTRRRITMLKLAVSIVATICSFVLVVTLFSHYI